MPVAFKGSCAGGSRGTLGTSSGAGEAGTSAPEQDELFIQKIRRVKIPVDFRGSAAGGSTGAPAGEPTSVPDPVVGGASASASVSTISKLNFSRSRLVCTS
jgi:hypothetical protein